MKIDLYTAFEALILCFGLVSFTAVIGLLCRRSLGVLSEMIEVIVGIISGEMYYDPQVSEAKKQRGDRKETWSVHDLIHLRNGLVLLQMLSDDEELRRADKDGLDDEYEGEGDI